MKDKFFKALGFFLCQLSILFLFLSFLIMRLTTWVTIIMLVLTTYHNDTFLGFGPISLAILLIGQILYMASVPSVLRILNKVALKLSVGLLTNIKH